MPKHVVIYVNLDYNEKAKSVGISVSDILCFCQTFCVSVSDILCFCVRHSVFLCQTFRVSVSDISCFCVRHFVFLCQTFRVSVSDILCFCVRHFVFLCQTFCVSVSDIPCFCVRHSVFLCHTFRVSVSDILCFCVRHSVFLCQTFGFSVSDILCFYQTNPLAQKSETHNTRHFVLWRDSTSFKFYCDFLESLSSWLLSLFLYLSLSPCLALFSLFFTLFLDFINSQFCYTFLHKGLFSLFLYIKYPPLVSSTGQRNETININTPARRYIPYAICFPLSFYESSNKTRSGEDPVGLSLDRHFVYVYRDSIILEA